MSETKFTPGPWWTDAEYLDEESGCSIIAANTDAGPMPGNPTRGQVAFATEILPEAAATCQANAHLIAAAPDLYFNGVGAAIAMDGAARVIQEVATRLNSKPLADLVKAMQMATDHMLQALAKARGEA